MDMTGEYRIAAPRQRVWQALNDPETLKHCIPGCEEIDKLSDVEWTAKVTAKVGPVKARFGGKVTLSDLDPPNGYTITGEGTGGAAGFAKGGAEVKLRDEGGGTVLSYTVKAQVGGKLAQIGSRLIDGVARKMADDFFARFAQQLSAAPGVEVTAAGAPAAEASAPADSPPPPTPTAATSEAVTPPPAAPALARAPEPRPGLPPYLWIVGLGIIVLVILYFATR